jgi:hypothetical protein
MAGPPPSSRSGTLVLGAVVLGLLGTGWFFLSHFVMDTATADALGEALGVMLGVLVLVSVVGAIASSGGSHR